LGHARRLPVHLERDVAHGRDLHAHRAEARRVAARGPGRGPAPARPQGASMGRYFRRKLLIYGVTFFIAVTINFAIPRLMPGDPVARMLTRNSVANPETSEALRSYFQDLFGLDVPLWQQYLNYWSALFRGDMGVSIYAFPSPVADVVLDALPYTLALLLPAILLSWFAGNGLGALAARNKLLDNTVLPVG